MSISTDHRLSSSDFAAVMLKLGLGLACSLSLVGNTSAGGLNDPIPTPINFDGLQVGIQDITQLPASIGTVPDSYGTVTRLNFFRELPNGRRFANDQRGGLYEISSGSQPSLYANLDHIFPRAIYTGSLASGFQTFVMHPEFASNGIFYTLHAETPNGSPNPDTIDAGFGAANYHSVLTEWTADNPSAATFAGTRRELLRIGTGMGSFIHPPGDLSFNPTALPGDADYGMLYISGGDHAISTGGLFDRLQRLDTTAGTLLRINPLSPSVTGGPAGLGDYTIPSDNPFFTDVDGNKVNDLPNTFGEIYAYGFRNGHRMAWTEDGTLLISDIGEHNIEEVNVIHAGGNYGWGEREGTFINGQAVTGNAAEVYPLSTDVLSGAIDDGYEYPVLQFDHDEGDAISGGFVYTGQGIPELRNKFVFGNITDGRLYYADLDDMLAADDGIPSTTASIRELRLVDDTGDQTDLLTLIREHVPGAGRVDVRFGLGADGELYVTTKGDGFIRRLIRDPSAPLQADFNRDGLVDLLDLDILGSRWEQSGSATTGDANGDGLVNLLDLDILGSQWEAGVSFSEALSRANIPEPMLTMPLLLAAFVPRRRRR